MWEAQFRPPPPRGPPRFRWPWLRDPSSHPVCFNILKGDWNLDLPGPSSLIYIYLRICLFENNRDFSPRTRRPVSTVNCLHICFLDHSYCLCRGCGRMSCSCLASIVPPNCNLRPRILIMNCTRRLRLEALEYRGITGDGKKSS